LEGADSSSGLEDAEAGNETVSEDDSASAPDEDEDGSEGESEALHQEKRDEVGRGSGASSAVGSKRRKSFEGKPSMKRRKLDQPRGSVQEDLGVLYQCMRKESVDILKNQPIAPNVPHGPITTRAQTATPGGNQKQVSEMYAEITQKSAATVLKHITARRKLKSGSVFVDLGCGVGNILFHAAIEYPDISCVGYEIHPATYMAFLQLNQLLKDNKLDLDVKVDNTDICKLDALPKSTSHVYAWSSRFGSASICAVSRLFERSNAQTLIFAS
jgi:Histone methylation protein DOT1